MKVSRKELNPHNYPLTAEQAETFERLLVAVNALRDACGIPFQITSGVRSRADQARINPSQPGSAHTRAGAADILDLDGRIDAFCVANLPLLEKLGLYLEEPTRTPRWCHVQVIAPKSGRRIFWP